MSAAAAALNHKILYISRECTNLMAKNHQRRCWISELHPQQRVRERLWKKLS